MSSVEELNAAVQSAKNAFDSWSKMPIKERVQVFFRYRSLLERDLDELTKLVSEENGKTFDEAKAEVEIYRVDGVCVFDAAACFRRDFGSVKRCRMPHGTFSVRRGRVNRAV